jgi:hypothetical protein
LLNAASLRHLDQVLCRSLQSHFGGGG